MSRVKIRPATEDDVDAIAAVLSDGDAQHASALPHLFNDRETVLRAKEMGSHFQDTNAALLVAELKGGVVGLIHLEVKNETGSPGEHRRRYGWILSIDVNEANRRRGIGRALMDAGEQWARSRGASHLEFDVWDFELLSEVVDREVGNHGVDVTKEESVSSG
jgi:GNAT superfamily N-acetyltransferase